MTEGLDTAGSPGTPGAGEPSDATDRRRHPARSDLFNIVGSYLVLGVLAGVLWWLLVDPALFTKVSDGGAMGEVELGRRFNSDGWYAVIGTVAGLLSGVVITRWRSRDFLLTTMLLVLGAGVAAAVMALTGYLLGPGDTDVALAAASEGAQVPIELEISAKAGYLVWPITALLGALVVLWSPSRGGSTD